MTENEEFEFRARLEKEQGAAGPQLDSKGRYVVDPNAEQRRVGLRKSRFKDESPLLNAGKGFMSMGEDAGRGAILMAHDAGLSNDASMVAGFAADMGTNLIPVGGTGKAAATAGEKVLGAGGKWFMQQALGPKSRELANGDAAQAIETMLKEGINATAGGAAKLRTKIGELKAKVGEIISQSPAEVNRGYAYKELSSLLDEVGKTGAGYKPAQAKVLKAWDDFKNHPLLDQYAEHGDMIPIQTADQIKRASQQAVADSYGNIRANPAQTRSQMAIASGLKQGMEAAEPKIIEGNAKLHQYLTALEQIEPRAASFASKQLAGWSPMAGSPEAAMIALADRNPWLKSYIARALYSGREVAPSAAAQAGTATVMTSQEGR